MINFRCQACGACSQGASPNCKCTDDDRKAVIEAEKAAVDAMFASVAADPRIAKYATRTVDPKRYSVVTIGGE